MGRIMEKVISLLVVLFLLSYVGYQAYRYYYKPVSTETVYEYSVNRSVTGRGIAIRDESVMDENIQGVEQYLFEDADRVSVGQTVAELYRSSHGDKNVKRARELENEIQLLLEAQDGRAANIGNAEGYNREIKDRVAQLSVMASVGRYQGIGDMRSGLTASFNKKQISTGVAGDFGSRIDQLRRELDNLNQGAGGETVTPVKAPVSGYFSRSVDGYENRINLSGMKNYTLEDYIRTIDGQPPSGIGGKVGRMVLSQNWYFAAAVDKDDIEWLRPGRKAQLQFDQIPDTVTAVVSEILDHKNNQTAIILFHCDQMNEDVISLRVSGVDIRFEQLSGLRIDASDLRFDKENRRGVYILEDNVIRFRLIDPIYEEQGFLLSQLHYVDTLDREHVKQFDQIARGKDLYDGKPIQDY